MISNPPGVKVMATAIQKPPYDDSAVAPNVLPMAISLPERVRLPVERGVMSVYLPHAGKKLNQAAISKRRANDYIRLGNVPSAHVDTAQDEGGQAEAAEAQGSRVCKLSMLRGRIQTRLHLTTESRDTALGGVYTRQRAIVLEIGGLGVVRMGVAGNVTVAIAEVFLAGDSGVLRRSHDCFVASLVYTSRGKRK